MILVTTPTGNTGSLILRQLVEGGHAVRVLVRDPKKIPDDLRSKIEIAEGSLLEVESFAKALTGCDTVYYCIPQGVTPTDVMKYYEEFAGVAVEALKRAGNPRVVYLSGLGKTSPYHENAGTLSGLYRAEDMLAASGSAMRALHCPNFYEGLLWQIQAIAQTGMFFVAVPGDAKFPEVAIKDIASAAVKVLTDPSWHGVGNVGVIGPENLSSNETAELLSEALGKPIHFQQVSREQNMNNLLGFGLSAPLADAVADMYEAIAKGLYDAEPRTPATTAPTSLKQWINEVFVPTYHYMTSNQGGG